MPKLSVIMPSYNVISYIEECLDSIINQTLTDIEIICVDAGSEDGTEEVVLRYSQGDNRIKLIHSSVKSYGAQMNLGIRNATGEYIGIVETDDYVSNEMFEKLYSCASTSNIDCARCGSFSFYDDENGRMLNAFRLFDENDSVYGKIIGPLDYPEIVKTDGNIWRGIYKRALFDGEDLFNETSGASYQDIGFSLQIFSRIKRMIYIPDCLYYYRTDRKDSSSYKPDTLRYLFQEFNWLLNEKKLLTKYPHMTNALYRRMAVTFANEYDKVLRSVCYDMGSSFISEYYAFFASELLEAKKNGYITERDFSKDSWNGLWEIVEHKEAYVEPREKAYILEEKRKQGLIEKCKDKKVIVFGCGIYGKKVIDILDGVSYINGFCDNDADKWGTIIRGIQVYSPQEAANEFATDLWVVANKKYGEDIINQLSELGIGNTYLY